MKTSAPPWAKLTDFLGSLPQCVVLRNHDIWESLVRGGNVDILAEDIEKAEKSLLHHLGTPTWTARRSYVQSYAYPWGKIDLLPSLEWHGAVYLPNRVVLETSERHDGLASRPRLAHEALVSLFSSLLWGGFFKERYRAIILEAARKDGAAFRHALIYATGRHWGERLWQAAAEGRPADSAGWAKQVRRAVHRRAFRREPCKTLLRWLAFWEAEVRLRLDPPVPWVAFLGPDGSGKSSVVAALGPQLAQIFSGTKTYHWRPRVLLSSRKGGEGPITDPHGTPPRGALISSLKLVFLLLDWALGYWGRLVHLRAKGHLLLFDRNYHDIVVDPRRYRYGGPEWFARLVGRLVPRPDLLVLLDAPPEVSQARKQEVTLEETRRQREAYLGLAETSEERRTVDASRPLDEVVAGAERAILDHVAWRTARRLGLDEGNR